MIWHNTEKERKVLVIGLDGATWEVLNPLMAQGHMPHLRKLVTEGVNGDLLSTIPCFSGPAWTSFMTGKNPGKHGIFGFTKTKDRKSYDLNFNSFKDIKTKTILHILSDAGKEVGSINLPLTYPPFEINGFIVGCGLLTPDKDAQFFYPKGLFGKLDWPKHNYPLDFLYDSLAAGFEHKEVVEKLLKKLITSCEQRKDFTLAAMKKLNWQFLTVVFGEVDRLQHWAWQYVEKSLSGKHDSTDKKITQLILKFYHKVDEAVGELAKQADKKTHILVISDHGFGCWRKVLYINNILKESGLLSLRSPNQISRRLKKLLNSLNKKPGRKVKNKYLDIEGINSIIPFIDWRKTKAFYLDGKGGSESGIIINLKGREPHGIVREGEEYERVLERVIDAFNNAKKRLVDNGLDLHLYKRTELYHGNYTNQAPDLILHSNSAYSFGSFRRDNKLLRPCKFLKGRHRRAGILVMHGKNFKQGGTISKAKITDIAPTILYLLDVPIPEDMDGRLLENAFQRTHLRANSAKHKPVQGKEDSPQEIVYSEQDKKLLRKRLKNLGYLE